MSRHAGGENEPELERLKQQAPPHEDQVGLSSAGDEPAKQGGAARSSRSKKGSAGDGRDAAGSTSVRLSKALSWLLRHGAEKEKVPIRPDGFVRLRDALDVQRIRSIRLPPGQRAVGLQEVREVVESNEKKRFELRQEGDEVWIRAVQGHSLSNVSGLRARAPHASGVEGGD